MGVLVSSGIPILHFSFLILHSPRQPLFLTTVMISESATNSPAPDNKNILLMKTTVHYLACCLLMLVSFGAMAAGHTVTITVDQHATCFGYNDGQATAVVAGGTGPFTYAWDDAGATISDILMNVGAGTYTVTVTDQSDMSTETATCTITEPAEILPVATSNSPICEGSTLNLSAANIAGASYLWTGPGSFNTALQNPSISSATAAESGIYAVIATVGGCNSDPVTVNVVVNAIPSPPFISANSGVCEGSSLVLNASFISGATYLWTGPAGFSSASQNPSIFGVTQASAGMYTVMVSVNGCLSTPASTNVTITAPTAPTWASQSPVCQGSTPPSIIAPSNAAGCNGTWNPATISTASAGTQTIYWTPNGGCCMTTGSYTVTVVPPVVPTFTPLFSVCQGDPVNNLPTISNNGITGVWNPASVNTSAAGTSTYTFTPTAGQCATTATLSQTVNMPTIPTFNPLPAICMGGTAPTLPPQSNNGITGSWAPGLVDNTASATYTFTPQPGMCASTASLTVIVNTPVVPTFTTPAPFCAGSTPPALPTTSNNSFTGTWTPGTVSNTSSGTYSFEPTPGSCATYASLTITVNTAPALSSLIETCDGGNTSYTLEVELSGAGSFNFLENAPGGIGGAFSGNVWTSNAIPTAVAYDIDFNDVNGCGVLNVSGVKNCSCVTDAGSMNLSPLQLCEGQTATAVHNGDQVFDADDIISYVLHTGSSGLLGTVIATSTTASFDFAAPMNYGTTYYISAVAGNDDGSGIVDLTDPCLSVSPGKPVVWYQTPVATPTNNGPVCQGGSVQLTANAIPGGSYSWTGPNGFTSPSQSPIFTADVSGTYQLVITAQGCASIPASTTVTVNTTVTPVFTAIAPYCQGDFIAALPTVSNNGISGTWSPAINNMATTTYTFSPTAGSCATTAFMTIYVGPPTVPTFSQVSAFCSGDATPALQVPSNEGISGTWSPATIDNTTTGTYIFTPTAGDCASTTSMTIVVNPNPVINVPSVSTCTNVPVVLTASGANSYVWTPATGLDDPNSASVVATVTSNQTYTVTGTDANGCVSNTTATVTVAGGLTIMVTPSNPSVCPGGSVVLSASGAADYTWSPATGLSSTTSGSVTAMPTTTTTYTVEGSTSGCIGSTTVTVTVSPMPVVSITAIDASCVSNCDGAIQVLTSPAGLPYIWTGTSTGNGTSGSITDLCVGSYTVTATNGGCNSAPSTIAVDAPTGIDVTINPTNPTTCTSCDGALATSVTGGSGSYTYSWSGPAGFSSTQNGFNNACPGLYSLTVDDGSGCNTTETIQLNNGAIDLVVTGTSDNCGGGTGSAAAAVTGTTGNVTYHWAPTGLTSQSIFGLSSGVYTVSIMDEAGCTESASVTIANTNAPNVFANATPASCGASDGTITINVGGGTPPFQYALNSGTFGSVNSFTGLAQGTYTAKVKDNNGCIATSSVNVGNSGNLLAGVNFTNATCSNSTNGSATINTYNGTAPYTYQWSNGQTTQTINNLAPGYYSCQVSDASGCQNWVSAYIHTNNNFYVSTPYWIYDNCGTADITANVSSYYGSPNSYTYLWSNGATTQTITDVPPGPYSVTVTNSAGCTRTASSTVVNNDYSYINGKVYIDPNANCIMDAAEHGFGATVTATGPTGTVYTGYANWYNGTYSIPVPNATGNFTINLTPTGMYNLSYYTLNCPPATVTLSANCQTINNIDFAYTANPAQDLSINAYCGTARPGFTEYIGVTYSNPGTTTMNGTVKVDLDPLLSLYGSYPTPSLVSSHHLEWNFTGLAATESRYITIYAVVPTIENGGALGTPINVHATIEPFAGDLAVANNTSDCSTPIVGSYDPNMKEVYSPQAHSSGAIDSAGAELYYTVHFQNTGTDTAFTIVVRDTLSPFVDLATLEMLDASHHYTWSLQPGRCLEVRFNQILLVDSNRNEPMSHGHFNYRIRTIEDLPLGAQIDNTAGIYFDFNEPVITNTVSSPVVAFANVEEKDLLQATVYPNPNNTSSVRVKLNGMSYDEITFELMDANGRIVRSDTFNNSPLFDINLDGLQNGIYFYTITNEQAHRSTGKLIISK